MKTEKTLELVRQQKEKINEVFNIPISSIIWMGGNNFMTNINGEDKKIIMGNGQITLKKMQRRI